MSSLSRFTFPVLVASLLIPPNSTRQKCCLGHVYLHSVEGRHRFQVNERPFCHLSLPREVGWLGKLYNTVFWSRSVLADAGCWVFHGIHQIEAMLFCAPGAQGSYALRDPEVGSMSWNAFQVILARDRRAMEKGLTVPWTGGLCPCSLIPEVLGCYLWLPLLSLSSQTSFPDES